MNRCPICSSKVDEVWESSGGVNGSSWFTGLYRCAYDGHIRASGVERDGERIVASWNPECPDHGTDPVYQVDLLGRVWVCATCHRRMAWLQSRIHTIWMPYQGLEIDPVAVDEAMARIGGLPHD